jgi:hypothetical protein
MNSLYMFSHDLSSTTVKIFSSIQYELKNLLPPRLMLMFRGEKLTTVITFI